MAAIILHIGLPKTATTLLQMHVFNKLNKEVDYLGVFQPRTENQDYLYKDIFRLISNSSEQYKGDFNRVKHELESRLNKIEVPLLLSDEMICVDDEFVCWQEKIKRLSELFDGHDVQILVTTREPVSAIFSYYVELYHFIKVTYSNVIDFANKSNLVSIYNYEYLDSVICENFNVAKVNYVPFELLKNDMFVSVILNKLDLKGDVKFEMPNENMKIKSAKGVSTHHKNIFSYFSFISKIPVISTVVGVPVVKKILRKPMALAKKTNMPMSSMVIKKLTDDEISILQGKYANSNIFIESKIDYDYNSTKK
ncbi:hypothetical protein [Vibrio sp. F13]|uniref:hypothetical protein n=1 Tax=Vibrio sp. F13 TaxID=2070777 RepID=UPI0010BD092D|nr:hypothetical protein [Vibrio sp. F13]TKF99447.1 hypothetical protein FCV76_19070 [Vibrio sp. F13]